MKKNICNLFKKILITVLCICTIGVSVPKKAEADTVGSFVNLIEDVFDAVMWALNYFIAGNTTDTCMQIKLSNTDYAYIYDYDISPYQIFASGNIDENDNEYGTYLGIFDANFFDSENATKSSQGYSGVNSSEILKPVVARVYKSLRNLALVLMLLVLLYIGIKIILSSVSKDNAKYKQMLIDWVVGFCLLFIMHYIMAFIMNMNTLIVKMLRNEESSTYYISLPDTTTDNFFTRYIKDWKTGMNAMFGSDFQDTEYSSTFDDISNVSPNMLKKIAISEEGFSITQDGDVINFKTEANMTSDELKYWGNGDSLQLNASIRAHQSGSNWYDAFDTLLNGSPMMQDKIIYKCNMMEYIRTITSVGSDKVYLYDVGNALGTNEKADYTETSRIGLAVLYMVLVVETVIFTVIYIKRVIQLAFYTIIAPIIAFMYPIDKIGDGSAQSYNKWFKDYLFTTLLQPMHLLLYTIFIVSAVELYRKNIIYALVIYGFMIPAEKYIKSILGFEKASSGGGSTLAGGIGAGMAMSGFNMLTKGLGSKSHGGKGGSDGKDAKKSKIHKLSHKGVSDPAGSGGSGGSGSSDPSGAPKRKFISRDMSGLKSLGKGLISPAAVIGRKISKAVTGGRYGDVLNAPAGSAVKALLGTGIKTAGKIATGAAIGTLGLTAGAVTAMATGDPSKLIAGAAAGVTAGWNKSGIIVDGVESLANEASAWRAENDENYAIRLREKEAMRSFDDENLTKEQKEVVQKYARYVDFNGDTKQIDALINARNALGPNASIDEVVTCYDNANKFGNLNEESKRKNLEAVLINEQRESIKKNTDEATMLSGVDINKKANELKKREIDKLKAERAKKIQEQGGKDIRDSDKKRIIEEYKRQYREISKRNFSDEAKEQAKEEYIQNHIDYNKVNQQVNATWKCYDKIGK